MPWGKRVRPARFAKLPRFGNLRGLPAAHRLRAERAEPERARVRDGQLLLPPGGPGGGGRLRRALSASPGGRTATCSSRCSSAATVPVLRRSCGRQKRSSFIRSGRAGGASAFASRRATVTTRCCTRSTPVFTGTARAGHALALLRRSRGAARGACRPRPAPSGLVALGGTGLAGPDRALLTAAAARGPRMRRAMSRRWS